MYEETVVTAKTIGKEYTKFRRNDFNLEDKSRYGIGVLSPIFCSAG